MLHTIVGLCPRGRQNELFARMEKCEGKVVLIVPEQQSFESERVLSEHRVLSHRNVEVLSFSRLAQMIFRTYGTIAGEIADDGAKLIMMYAAYKSVESSLSYLAPKSSFYGYSAAIVTKLLSAYGEISNANVTPSDLLAVSEKTENKILSLKSADMAKIFFAYEGLMPKGYKDGKLALRRSAKFAQDNNFFSDMSVFVEGFTGFTGSEMLMLETILTTAKDLTLSFCCDDIYSENAMGIFAKTYRTAKKLTAIAKEKGIAVASPFYASDGAYRENAPLRHLAENFLFPSPLIYDEDVGESIQVISAMGPYDEARFVAAKCKELAYCGYRWRDISIIARSLSLYDTPLIEAFQKEDIPLFIDRREDISSRAPTAFIISAINALRFNYDTNAIMRMLKTGLMGLTPSEIATLEDYVFTWSINHYDWIMPFTKSVSGLSEKKAGDDEKLAQIEAIRLRIITPLNAFGKRVMFTKAFANGKNFAHALWDFIEESDAKTALLAMIKESENGGDKKRAEELISLWHAIIKTIDRFADILGDTQFSDEDALHFFELALSTSDMGSIPAVVDTVSFGEANRMRPSHPKVVFVMGVSEGVFPAPPAEGSLFSDSERDEMARLSVNLADTAEEALIEERLFAYSAFSCSTQMLFVSYSRADIAGAENTPSMLISRLLGIFPKISIKETKDMGSEFFLHNEATAFTLLTEEESPTPFSMAIKEELMKKSPWNEYVSRLGVPFSPQCFSIDDKSVNEALYAGTMRLSPSGVEAFHKCPFSFFISNTLKLREKRKAELSPLESGDIIHQVLECVLKKFGADKLLDIDKSTLDDYIEELLAARTKEAFGESDMSPRFMALLSRLKDHLHNLIIRLGEEFRQSAFVPVAFEQAVDEGEDVEPLSLITPEGKKVLVRGRIDRVDVLTKNGKKYVRVVDYKSGSKDFRLSDVLYGLNTQMLIYLFAISDGGKNILSNCLPAGVLYMPAKDKMESVESFPDKEEIEKISEKKFVMNGLLLDDEDVLRAMEPGLGGLYIPVKEKANGELSSSSLVTVEELGRIRRHIYETLEKMAEELLSGGIMALPADLGAGQTPCDYCGAKPICRRGANAPLRYNQRFKNDEALEILKGMEG